jgi:biotin transport system substrate-specific component
MTVRVADRTLLTTVIAGPDARLARALSVALMTALTILAAQFSLPLPFTPVPLTLQPMVVLLGAAVLGSKLGAASQILYLALGIAGLPVFAASPVLPQGAMRLLGPTGGYLMAYPAAAFATGLLAERGCDRRYWSSLAAMTAGLAVVFAGGVAWLSAGAPSLGVRAALQAGFWPFVGVDVVKLAIAAGILPTFWRFVPARATGYNPGS